MKIGIVFIASEHTYLTFSCSISYRTLYQMVAMETSDAIATLVIPELYLPLELQTSVN
jgi:hypothetical protein